MHESYHVYNYFNCVTGDETVWSVTAKKIGPVSKDGITGIPRDTRASERTNERRANDAASIQSTQYAFLNTRLSNGRNIKTCECNVFSRNGARAALYYSFQPPQIKLIEIKIVKRLWHVPFDRTLIDFNDMNRKE